ncbi:hypothetical protein ACFFKH_20720 [Micromonospora marina]|uniref:hypothetical protein n=1 Tax=Micromonospora TaxID=1873 RepID=UPI0003613BB8|nr:MULTISPECIES: hypothetical protein [Micromonospora]
MALFGTVARCLLLGLGWLFPLLAEARFRIDHDLGSFNESCESCELFASTGVREKSSGSLFNA